MDGRRDLRRIAGVIRESGADIVCLQEVHQRVPWSGFANQPRQLEKLLGWPVVFQRNLTLGFGGEGTAIASRFPILRTARHRLTSVRERRGILEVRLKTPTEIVTVFNTHWGLNDKERQRQARQSAKIVHAATGPLLVCGDFNERAEGTALQEFLSETGLRDADSDANRSTYPADRPRARIDFVFFSDDWKLGETQTIETSASDHWPVVADLERAGSEDASA